MTISTDSYIIGSSPTPNNNFLLDTDGAGGLRIRRRADGSGGLLATFDAAGNLQLGDVANANAGRMIRRTALATTSGATAGFTGIPAWANKITAFMAGVSTAGATNVGVQVGSGSYATTGYNGAQSQLNGATGSSANTSSMVPLDNAASAVNVRSGRITFHHMGGNLWVWDGVVACAGSSIVEMTAGSIQLAGALDRLQLLMNGADTFDAGSVNLLIEG